MGGDAAAGRARSAHPRLDDAGRSRPGVGASYPVPENGSPALHIIMLTSKVEKDGIIACFLLFSLAVTTHAFWTISIEKAEVIKARKNAEVAELQLQSHLKDHSVKFSQTKLGN